MLNIDASEILNKLLELDSLTDLQHTVLQKAWEGKTYPEIAQDLDYDAGYVRDLGSKLWRVLSDTLSLEINKTNFRSQIQRYFQTTATTEPIILLPASLSLPFSLHDFCGREQEQVELTDWIEHQQCRLIAILGMGGIGKTMLTQHLAQTLQPKFERVVWCSLHNAPSIREVIADILGTLGHLDDEIRWEDHLEHSLTLLLSYLRQYRCLLIFDNLETIFRSGEHTGDYREGYEEYDLLFAHIVQTSHQSCLLVTSREKSKAISMYEERSKQVRSLTLNGLSTQAVQKMLENYNFFSSDSEDWEQIINHYGGNPLILKLVSINIRGLFDGDIAEFGKLLTQGIAVSDDVDSLLAQQFRRLSLPEKEIIYWIASQHEALTYAQINNLLLNSVARNELPRMLERLKRRSLLEDSRGRFTLQPMVAEYIIGQLLQELCGEIETGVFNYLNRLALLNTQATDYVRSAQMRQLVQPLIHHLVEKFCTQRQLEQRIEQLKNMLQESQPHSGYAAGNLLNLLSSMGADLRNRDFSNLTIRHADLVGKQLHGLNLQNCTFADSVFSETFGSVLCIAMSLDGAMVAAGTTSNDIYIWESSSTNSVAVLRGHQGWVRSISFSPDGRTLASASEDLSIQVCCPKTGHKLLTFTGHECWIWSVAFSPDPTLLASASEDKTVRVWSLESGQCLSIFQGHTHGVRSISFSPDGRTLASGGLDGTVRIWDLETQQLVETLQTGYVHAIAFSADGQHFAYGNETGFIYLCDAATRETMTILQGHTNRISSLCFSADSQFLLSGSDDHTAKLWQAHDRVCLQTLLGHQDIVTTVAFGTDSTTAITGSLDATIRVWSLENGITLQTMQVFRPYERMNIANVSGLTETRKAKLKMLGATSVGIGGKMSIDLNLSSPSLTFTPS